MAWCLAKHRVKFNYYYYYFIAPFLYMVIYIELQKYNRKAVNTILIFKSNKKSEIYNH